MSSKFEDKISSLTNIDKIVSMNYFTKFEAYTKLLEIVVDKKPLVRNSFGNYSSKVVFVVEFDNTNDPIIDLIKKYYNSNNRNFYSIYITPLSKFEDNVLDIKILSKELEIIKPKKIISLGIDIPKSNKSLSKSDLYEILQYLKDKSNKDTENFKIAKNNLLDCMNFAMNG